MRQGVTLEVLDKADGHFLQTRSRILDVEDQRGRRTGLGERLDQRDLRWSPVSPSIKGRHDQVECDDGERNRVEERFFIHG